MKVRYTATALDEIEGIFTYIVKDNPRHNPVNAFTMGGIVRDAGLSVEQFRELL